MGFSTIGSSYLIQLDATYRELLKYLNNKDIKATFFVVGSRVIEKPDILIEEYMSGHEISVHTWSHRLLTNLTNQQIVAELGFTREAIKQVLGVSPTTMRPPQGDIGTHPSTHAQNLMG